VTRLDLEEKIAHVKPDQYDYYTQAIDRTSIIINEQEEQRRWRVSEIGLGEVTVTTLVYMFRKIKFFSRDSIGFGNLDLPARELFTVAFWLTPPPNSFARVREFGRIPEEGLLGIANVACAVLPLFVMCDQQDIGTVVDSSQIGSPTLFIYDKYPGGLGFAEKAFELVDQVIEACLFLLQECECDDGCPSCVGSPLPVYAPGDQDTRGKIPDKEAALCILHDLLEREPYVPKPPPAYRETAEGSSPADAAGPGDERRPIKRLPAAVEKRIRERLRKLND
jgi:DEAD/DEAH box helicase domain-containing protein